MLASDATNPDVDDDLHGSSSDSTKPLQPDIVMADIGHKIADDCLVNDKDKDEMLSLIQNSDCRDIELCRDIRTVAKLACADDGEKRHSGAYSYNKQSSVDHLNNKESVNDNELPSSLSRGKKDSLLMNSRVSSEGETRQHHKKDYNRQSDKHSKDDHRGAADRDSDGRSHRHRHRHRSRSTEDRHCEGSTRRKRHRTESRSRERERSPRNSQDRNSDRKEHIRKRSRDDEGSSKAESVKAKIEITGVNVNGERSVFDNQGSSDRTHHRKEVEEEKHSVVKSESVSKDKDRERSPYGEVNRTQLKSPGTRDRYDESHSDRMQNKRRRLSSPEAVSRDRDSHSDQRYHRHRSRSHGRHHRSQGQSYQRRRRSKSNSHDNSRSYRNRSESFSKPNDEESKSGTSEKKQRSRTRSKEKEEKREEKQEDKRDEKCDASSEDRRKRMYEDDRWNRRHSNSKLISRHENYPCTDREGRHSLSRDRAKEWTEGEWPSDRENLKRRRSRSSERNSSKWQERKQHHDEYTRDKSENDGTGYSNKPALRKRQNSRGDRWNSWSRGDRGESKSFRDHPRGNFNQNRWHGSFEHPGNNERTWNQDRRGQGWDESRHRYEGQGDEEKCPDDGQRLEDMVTKSLAKLRQDSDKEQQNVVADGLNEVPDEQIDRDRNLQDHSAIPVLLSKKSSYKKDSYNDCVERTGFAYNCGTQERQFVCNSSSPSTRSLDAPGFPHSKVRQQPIGQLHFRGNFQHPTPPPVEFQARGKALHLPPPHGLVPAAALGVRLPPGAVQHGLIVAPFHLRPPGLQEMPRSVDWRVVGPLQHPPPVGPRGQLVSVGGFIRTQVPVEFLARHPVPQVQTHPSGPPFQPGMPPPPHSLPPGSTHPGVSLQSPLVRANLPGDPHRMQHPVALVHPHHLQMQNPKLPPRGLVDIRHHIGHPPGILPPHPPPTAINLAIPPPPLPVRLAGPAETSLSLGFSGPTGSPQTPPPPPPPAVVSAGSLDPRLNSLKLLSHRPLPAAVLRSPSSTSDESLESEFSGHRGDGISLVLSGDDAMQSRSLMHQQQQPQTPPTPLSSDSTPQHITEDAYTDALFEEPYHRPSDEPEGHAVHHVPENSTPEAPQASVAVERISLSEGLTDVPKETSRKSQAAYKETSEVPEIINPMASPSAGEEDIVRSSPTGSTSGLNVSAHTLQMIHVADLKKVLETVRTSAAVLNDEEVKSQDKQSNRMEQIAEEVKLALKPHFGSGHINKDEYKDIMRKAVPKIFSSKSTLDRGRIQTFVEEYVNKILKSRKSERAKKSTSQSQSVAKHSSKASSKAI